MIKRKEIKNKVIPAIEDKYSAEYWRNITNYQGSEKKIFDTVINDIYVSIEKEAKSGKHFCSFGMYSINYLRYTFKVDYPGGKEKKKRILSDVKSFLIEKGFKCTKNGIQLEIEWF